MAIFTGKIIDAYYTNPEYSIIKVLFEDEAGVMCPHHISVDESPDFKELEDEGWDHEKLLESTAEIKRAQSTAFNIEVNNAAKALIAETMMDQPSSDGKKLEKIEDYFNLFANDTDKDNLFKCKLWALETSYMKDATKDQKSKLRKSKSLLEVFAILYEIKQSQE